ncbi:TlpA family protein disulfide reductase [Shewanella sp. D64]|uniref:TlpA family protein disulfide reductase n=1 Tax=unclassified Shewanella TaxID=196818 RepID=UPI0022BA444D|nr:MULTISPECIES: TlpA disulfide reductase family protein [unclassified Shewanella]MEC4726704.1 TlpA family protein disulfide reductase [Shewanella sp. D64]MEC4738932.1 TlpA family protein disulfide reductase [Shewanella sp. E94]WBJ96915.1 TlpA family protein disulfide reductase [Shewanella sp. MTB7]
MISLLKSIGFGLSLSLLICSQPALVHAQPTLNIEVHNSQNQLLSLDEFKGQVVYVDFWASWCGPCRKSFPWLNAMHDKYQQQGLAIVAINLDEDKAAAEKFLAAFPARFHVRFDPQGKSAQTFDLQGMPSSYIFNRKGELVQQHVGFFSEHAKNYERNLSQLLKELP